MSNQRLNTDRERLLFAFQKASGAKSDKYKARVEKTPMLVYNNGLGNTFAFIYSNRKKAGWEELYTHIFEWLNEKFHITTGKLSEEAMAGELIDSNKFAEVEYRAITREVLKLLEGLKRFAKDPKKKPVKETAEKTSQP